ncbi:CD3324 family protein [Pseudoruminococcus massiliensis]|uniref:CD3324 family protein n=1 Tax=Pseudoruminococcus massiliensis TaxID=2086583 RepID=UPI0040289F9C
MKYINANTILPDMLVEELQKYVQAGYIYIPAKDEQHKSWGELSGYRKELAKRNAIIIMEYKNGVSVAELADRYFLSVSAIRKIIYQK